MATQHVRFNPPMDSRNYESLKHRLPARWTHITFLFCYGTLGWEHLVTTPNATWERVDNGRGPTIAGLPLDHNWDVEVTYPRSELADALSAMAKLAGREDIVASLEAVEVEEQQVTVTTTERRSLRDWRQYLG